MGDVVVLLAVNQFGIKEVLFLVVRRAVEDAISSADSSNDKNCQRDSAVEVKQPGTACEVVVEPNIGAVKA